MAKEQLKTEPKSNGVCIKFWNVSKKQALKMFDSTNRIQACRKCEKPLGSHSIYFKNDGPYCPNCVSITAS